MIDRDQLVRYLVYDEVSGQLANRVNRGRARAGVAHTCLNNCGYVVVRLDDALYLAHRLVWLYVNGDWPDCDIDHINGVRTDNRVANLRLVSRKQNLENQGLQPRNTSGHRGVSWDRRRQKWICYLTHNYKRVVVGRFSDIDDAVVAVKRARDSMFTHHKTEYAA